MRISTGVSAGLSLTLVSCGYLLIIGPGGVAGAAATAADQSADQNAVRVSNSPADWPTAPPMRSAAGIPVTAATGPAVQPMSMPAPPDMTIGLARNGDTISLALGQTLVVALDGNATTGYVWELGRVKKRVLSTDGDVTYAPTPLATPRPGGGGVFTARFTAVGLGESYVKLVYDRPFEVGAPPVKSFTVLVLVTPESTASPSLAPTTAPMTPPMTTSMR